MQAFKAFYLREKIEGTTKTVKKILRGQETHYSIVWFQDDDSWEY